MRTKTVTNQKLRKKNMNEPVIICNDSMKEMGKFEDKSFDWCLTSPPYNRKRNDKYTFYDDVIVDYKTFLKENISEMLRITRKGVFFNIQTTYYNRNDVYWLIGEFADKIQEIFIWEKDNPMPASGHNITNSVEYFILFGDKRPQSNTTYTKNVIHSSVAKMPKIHKAVMKQEVCDWFFNNFFHEGESVIDPFCGCGTTGISAVKYGLDFVGIDICEEYCNYAKEQIMTFFRK